ncbi:hypothetical protein HAX54_030322, partial [Datura stramonium]|nr:hypothetical protein [Datura stramonium]
MSHASDPESWSGQGSSFVLSVIGSQFYVDIGSRDQVTGWGWAKVKSQFKARSGVRVE